jgi:AAA-like domain
MTRASRAWRLSSEGQNRAETALKISDLEGQKGLGAATNLVQSTVSNFLKGKNVDIASFKSLCKKLKLDPDEVRLKEDLDISLTAPYVKRINEQMWCEKILEPQALISILAPTQFGKTSLMYRMLDRAMQQGHLAIFINLEEIFISVDEIETVNPLSTQIFLQHFVKQIGYEIVNIDEKYVDDLMSDQDYGDLVSKFSHRASIRYLEHLQKHISKPLTIGIDRLDLLLSYPDTACTFFTLLRLMNERSMRGGIWKNFRMVLAHSTPSIESLIDLPDNQSPFTAYPIELPEFTSSQIADLASQRRLSLRSEQIDKLMQSIGGIPSLVKLTLDRIEKNGDSTFMLEPSAIEYNCQNHLQVLVRWLQNNDLLLAMYQVVHHPDDSNLPFRSQCLLHRKGLVVFTNNKIKARCELYYQYFLKLNIDE